jgi:hypothetical protein
MYGVYSVSWRWSWKRTWRQIARAAVLLVDGYSQDLQDRGPAQRQALQADSIGTGPGTEAPCWTPTLN